MVSEGNKLLFENIVEDIQGKIHNGEFSPGDRLFSINEFNKFYNVSTMTSVRAVNELKAMGIVKSVKRKGLYINNIPEMNIEIDNSSKKIARIVVISSSSLLKDKNSLYRKINDSILGSAVSKGLQIRSEAMPVTGHHNIPLKPIKFEPGDGIIMVSGAPKLQIISSIIEQKFKLVLIDSAVSGVHCVLTDYHDGVEQIINYLESLNHNNIVFVSRCARNPNLFNEAEIELAFNYAAKYRNLNTQLVIGENFEELIKLFKQKSGPTAFIFAQDDPALRFIHYLEKRGIKVPEDVSVTGFDDFAPEEEGLEHLTTYQINCEKLGINAVKILLEDDNSIRIRKNFVRIPGKLMIRTSTATINK